MVAAPGEGPLACRRGVDAAVVDPAVQDWRRDPRGERVQGWQSRKPRPVVTLEMCTQRPPGADVTPSRSYAAGRARADTPLRWPGDPHSGQGGQGGGQPRAGLRARVRGDKGDDRGVAVGERQQAANQRCSPLEHARLRVPPTEGAQHGEVRGASWPPQETAPPTPEAPVQPRQRGAREELAAVQGRREHEAASQKVHDGKIQTLPRSPSHGRGHTLITPALHELQVRMPSPARSERNPEVAIPVHERQGRVYQGNGSGRTRGGSTIKAASAVQANHDPRRV